METNLKKSSTNLMAGCLGAALLIIPVASGQAQQTTYTDSSAWTSAVTGASTLMIPDIGDTDPDDSFSFAYGYPPASVTYSGVTFSTVAGLGDANLYNVGTLFDGDYQPAVLSPREVILAWKIS
jgi:hypothetical protein